MEELPGVGQLGNLRVVQRFSALAWAIAGAELRVKIDGASIAAIEAATITDDWPQENTSQDTSTSMHALVDKLE